MFNLTQAENLLENFKRINSALPVKDEQTTDDNQESLEKITLDINQAQQLIQDFKKLEKPPERKKAFLEIIGLSHLEAVSSKALAFFFDTDEVHQLKDLCVQALFDCILDRVKSKSEPAISTQSVEREVITEEGSRIDIIINTYDDLIIIENKLFHTVNNPFESYVNYGKLRRGERNGHYIILGIHKPETLPEHFKFISHFDLADAIRNRLGDSLMDADQHYVTLLVDYLHALDDFNPNSRIGKMEQAIVNFFGNNHDQLAEIYEARQHFIDYAKQKIENCNILFKEQNISIFDGNTENDSFPPDWLGFTIWSKSFTENEFSQNHGIAFYIAVGCYTKGCTLSLEYSKNLEGRGVPKDCLIKLKSILDEMNIEHDEMEEYADDAQFVIIRQASWDETPEKIVSEYLPIIKKIESALNLDKEA